MKGGELVFSNNKTCIFKPKVPCKGKRRNKLHLSKVVVTDDKSYKQEKEMNEQIKRIKNYKEWALVFDEFCDVPDDKTFKKYDKDIEDCRKQLFSEIFDREWKWRTTPFQDLAISSLEKNGKMMTGKYGGMIFADYCEKIFNKEALSRVEFLPVFRDFVSSLKSLFIGLKEMKKHKIVHLDVKDNNIVYGEKEKSMKFIDFGLSDKITRKISFETRSLNEYMTNRFYIWYPLDYLLYYAHKKNIVSNDIISQYHIINRVNGDFYMKIHNYIRSIFIDDKNEFDGYKIHDKIIQDIESGRISEKNMLEKIDIYGVGICILLNMIYYLDYTFLVNFLDNGLFSDFMNLCERMVHTDVNQRIDADEAYDTYMEISNKYLVSAPKKKLTKKKSIKREKVQRKNAKRKVTDRIRRRSRRRSISRRRRK